MESNFTVDAQWIFWALADSVFPIRFGISIALMEIIIEVIGGNIVMLPMTDWVSFLSGPLQEDFYCPDMGTGGM